MIRFNYKEINCNFKQDGKIEKEKCVLIVLEDTEKKIFYPHPLTHFWIKYYHNKSKKINTELAAAKKIIPFLNYINERVRLGDDRFKDIRGIADLKNEHVNYYLSYCVEEKGDLNSTSKLKEMYLSRFYKYLDDERILKQKPRFTLITRIREKKVHTVYQLDLSYKITNEDNLVRKIKRKDILSQHEELLMNNNAIRIMKIYEFLSLAKKVTPDIALGVALQIFAGLRKGEVVNLLRKSLISQGQYKYGENGLVIKVRNNQKILFDRLSSIRNEGVKKVRDQACIIDKILCDLFKHHLEVVIPSYDNIQNKKALFYDSKGHPMSGDVYDRRFKDLKNAYLSKLLVTEGRKKDYDDFAETRWRSHICRGIFTNLCHDAGFTVQQTAILRGDSTIEAMQSYYDILSATHNISRALDLISPIDNDVNKSVKINEEYFEYKKNDILFNL